MIRHRTHSFAVLACIAIGSAFATGATAFVSAVSWLARSCWDFVSPVVAREPSVHTMPHGADADGSVALVAAKSFMLRRAQREYHRLRQAWRTCPAL